MQSHLAVAAGDEAEVTLRGHRQIDRMPGVRSGTDAYSHQSGSNQRYGGLHPHNRQGSGSSASSGQRGGFGMAPVSTYASHVQARGPGLRSQTHTGRKLVPARDLNLEHRRYLTTWQNQHQPARHSKAVFRYSAVCVRTLDST